MPFLRPLGKLRQLVMTRYPMTRQDIIAFFCENTTNIPITDMVSQA
jgi:hypothetical protein